MERIDCACGKTTWIGSDGIQIEIHGHDYHGYNLFREHHCRISKLKQKE